MFRTRTQYKRPVRHNPLWKPERAKKLLAQEQARERVPDDTRIGA